MKFILPGKKMLLLIFIVALINPVHYALLFLFPPQNTVFLGYPDDSLMLTLMKSVQNGFSDPWAFDGSKVWNNPLIGAVYLFIVLGAIPSLLKIDLYQSFIFFKFFFSIFYYLVAYNVICAFVKEKKQRTAATLIFIFSAGLGGILYVLSAFFHSQYTSIIGYAITNEFNELSATAHSLTHTFRLYYMIPETIGYLSLLFYINKKSLYSGLALGLVFLFYPTYGIAFSLVILIYEIAARFSRKNVSSTIRSLATTYVAASIFLVPWIIAAIQKPYYYEISPLIFENLPTINIAVGFFFSLVLLFYYIKCTFNVKKSHIVMVTVAFALFVLKQFYETSLRSPIFKSWLLQVRLFDISKLLWNYALPIDAAIIVLSIFFFLRILKSGLENDKKFLLSWVVIFIALSGISPENIDRLIYTGRQAATLLLPMSVLASFGLIKFSKKVKLDSYKILAIVIILSIPSLIGYNLWIQKSVRESGISGFFTEDEYQSIKTLQHLENGTVLSSLRFGFLIPYYTNKKTLLFSGRTFDIKNDYLTEVSDDYKKFYKGTESDRIGIIRKYNIKYIVFGKEEAAMSVFNPDAAAYLREIKGGENKVYEVTTS